MFSTRKFTASSSLKNTATTAVLKLVSIANNYSSSRGIFTSTRPCCQIQQQQQVPAAAADATETASMSSPSPSTFCILCDEHVQNWHSHAEDPKHIARFAVAQELCAPERNAAMLSQLWDHIRLDFNAVDAASEQRVRRRRRRLSSTAKYLRDVHVLQDCLLFENVFVPSTTTTTSNENATEESSSSTSTSNNEYNIIEKVFFDEEGNERTTEQVEKMLMSDIFTVAPSFSKLVHVGERASRAELMDRCARLFPASTANELESIVALIMSPLAMASMFDLLDLKDVVYTRYRFDENNNNSSSAPPTTALPVTRNQETLHLVALPDFVKRQIILAIIGELSLWNTRDRPTSVGSKQDADTIVTHVLSLHVVENVLSELLHHSLQKVVDETTPVWREFKDTMSKFVMSSSRVSMKLEKEKTKKKSVDGLENNEKQMMMMNGLDALNFLNENTPAASSSSEIENDENDDVVSFFASVMSSSSSPTTASSEINPPQPKIIWRTMQVEGVLSASVPNPANKTAMFAMMKPQLNAKARILGTPNAHLHQNVSHHHQQQQASNKNNNATTGISLEDVVAQEQEAAAKEKKLEEQRKRNEQAAKIIAETQKQQREAEEQRLKNKEMLLEQQKKKQQQEAEEKLKREQQQQQEASKKHTTNNIAPEPKAEIKKPHQQQQNQQQQRNRGGPQVVTNQMPIKPRTPQQARAPVPPPQQQRMRQNAPPPNQQQQKIVTMNTIKTDPNRKMRLQPINHPPKPKP